MPGVQPNPDSRRIRKRRRGLSPRVSVLGRSHRRPEPARWNVRSGRSDRQLDPVELAPDPDLRCGFSDCADLAEGIYVRREPMSIYWTLRDPYFPKGWGAGETLLRYRILRFDPDEYHAAILAAIKAAPSREWDKSPRRIWPFGFDWHRYVRSTFDAAAGTLATLAEDYPWSPARIDVGRWLADRGSTLTRDLRSSDRHLDVVEWLQRDEELLARWQQWQGCFDERGHAVAGQVEEHLDEVGLGFASAIKRILVPDSDVRYFPVRELRPFGRPALSCLEHIEVAATAAPRRIQKET